MNKWQAGTIVVVIALTSFVVNVGLTIAGCNWHGWKSLFFWIIRASCVGN